MVDVLDSLNVCLIFRFGRFLIFRMWLEKMFFLLVLVIVSRFDLIVYSGIVLIRLCRVMLGCIVFLKCISIDLGIFSGMMLVVVVKVIRFELVGNEMFIGKWVCELLLVLMVLGSSMWLS